MAQLICMHALGFVVVGGEQFVVKKAIKNVAYKDLELTLLTLDGDGFGLHGEGENRVFWRSKETDSIYAWWTAMISTSSRAILCVSCC